MQSWPNANKMPAELARGHTIISSRRCNFPRHPPSPQCPSTSSTTTHTHTYPIWIARPIQMCARSPSCPRRLSLSLSNNNGCLNLFPLSRRGRHSEPSRDYLATCNGSSHLIRSHFISSSPILFPEVPNWPSDELAKLRRPPHRGRHSMKPRPTRNSAVSSIWRPFSLDTVRVAG